MRILANFPLFYIWLWVTATYCKPSLYAMVIWEFKLFLSFFAVAKSYSTLICLLILSWLVWVKELEHPKKSNWSVTHVLRDQYNSIYLVSTKNVLLWVYVQDKMEGIEFEHPNLTKLVRVKNLPSNSSLFFFSLVPFPIEV